MAKKKQNRAVFIAAVICAVCVVFMITAFLVPRRTVKGDFTPPPFAENVQQGVPVVPQELGWYTPQREGLNFKVSVCGEVIIEDGKADIYFTNYESNNVWLMVRMISESGDVLAESGIIKPGEYVQNVPFDTLPADGQTIYYKVMAYEPETYYSAGSFTLETHAQIGG